MSNGLEARVTSLESQVQEILKQLTLIKSLVIKMECEQAIKTIQTILGDQ